MSVTSLSTHAPKKPSQTNPVFQKLGGLLSKIRPKVSPSTGKKGSPDASTNTSPPLNDRDQGTSSLVASSSASETTSRPPKNNADDAGPRSDILPQNSTPEPITGSERSSEPVTPLQAAGRAKHTTAQALAGRFAQTVIKNLPNLVDGNPVKIAFSIAKLIVETKNSITDNQEAIDRYILKAAEKLSAVKLATNNGTQVPPGAEDAMNRFTLEITDILKELDVCKSASKATKLFDFENQSKKIEEVFGAISAATENFQIQMAVNIQRTADRIDATLKKQALDRLNPVKIAHYDVEVTGKSFCRTGCTAGTRVDVLKEIQDWVEDASPTSSIFWLTGHAGSGKTSVLYTIAEKAEESTHADNTRLGGTFFCSRQFAETREPNHIIPTIIHQLASFCQPFEDALQASILSGAYSGLFHRTSINIRTQITSLLVIPWQQCAAMRTQHRYLIVIDALDEIDEQGASYFLPYLFAVIRDHKLGGLKFLISSRADPNIRKQIESFQFRKELWLQHVSAVQASADVRTYLQGQLPNLRPEDLQKIEWHANGLFIYAATVVRYLKPGPQLARSEQMVLLHQLFSYSASINKPSPSESLIDSLYQQILFEAFSDIPEPLRSHRLKILHFFLSTADRGDSATIAALVGDESDEIAKLLVERLHSVLHIEAEDGRVSWFHSSFPEFIFDPTRSRFSYPRRYGEVLVPYDFSCNHADQQATLFYKCFSTLNSQLKLNIGNIPSSFFLDSQQYIDKSGLGQALVHASLHWSSYLPEVGGNIDHFAEVISSFLQSRVLFWMEAMNILDKADACSNVLERAERWAVQFLGENNSLHADLQEVNRFVSAFVRNYELNNSTPHLYISHLAGWPEPGRLISKWKTHFIGLPVLTHSKSAAAVIAEDGVSRMGSTFERVQSTIPPGPVWSARFLETDTQMIVSTHSNGSFGIWDIATGEPLKQIQGHVKPLRCVAISQDGKLIVSGSDDKSARVWHADTGESLHCLEGHTAPVRSVAINHDGTKVVSGSHDCSVRIWSLGKVQMPMVLTGHTGWVLSVAISPDGTFVVSGSKDKTVRVWEASTGIVLQILKGHTDRVNSVAITTDKTQVVSASNDHTVRLWSRSTGRSISVLRGHSSWVNTVAIAPDDSTIVSGSRDRTIGVWDAKTGQSLQTLYGHTNFIFSVSLSQNGQHVISGSRGGSMRVWDISGRTKSVLLSPNHVDACLSTLMDARYLNWQISDDANWIVSSNSEGSEERRLMWMYGQVADPSNICVIGGEGYRSIDFSQSVGILGDNWTQCYTPVPADCNNLSP